MAWVMTGGKVKSLEMMGLEIDLEMGNPQPSLLSFSMHISRDKFDTLSLAGKT